MTLASLVVDACERNPGAAFGTVEDRRTLADAVELAAGLGSTLADAGIGPGTRVAVVGPTSTSYLTAWLALQLRGAETALVNPTYTDEMLRSLLEDLDPAAVVLVDRPLDLAGSARRVLDATDLAGGTVVVDGEEVAVSPEPVGDVPGTARDPMSVAGYMHTSGTTGPPKFCAQSHEYFRRLGGAVAGALGLESDDVVFAPLPMFHINPLGYGVVGALTARAGVLGAERFSASSFWTDVSGHGVTALVMHAPPVEILKRRTEGTPAHSVRTMFYADAEFMSRFRVPRAVTAYGSTEAGGVAHLHVWTVEDAAAVDEAVEGSIARYGGRPRPDIEARLADDGTIWVRSREPGALFSGYLHGGEVVDPTDDGGWFDTGDIGTLDAGGGLRFVERRAESIRVKGEYVPIPLVESALVGLGGVEDLALWKRPGSLGDDDEVVLFTSPTLPELADLTDRVEQLPRFMRPRAVVAVPRIPRDDGVGKVRRRSLDELTRLAEVEL